MKALVYTEPNVLLCRDEPEPTPGNDEVLVRGTFANIRIKNLMVPGVEGGYTLYFGEKQVPAPDREIKAKDGKEYHQTWIYDRVK